MMKIKIFCVGKIREQYLKEGINEYLKKISAYSNIEIVEVIVVRILHLIMMFHIISS